MAGPWDTIGAPNYAAFPNDLGNALAGLVPNFQASQQSQQRTQANDLRNQSDQLLLNQSKAFAGGLPMNPDGTPNYAGILKTLAEKGDIGAISSLAPVVQQQQNIDGANAPDPIFGGGASSGGNYKQPSAPAAGPWSSNAFLSTQVGAESEGDNRAVGDNGLAKGDFQFHDATWQRYAKNVPGASQYASAADAPPEVQQAVAETAPLSEWGPRTKAILHAKFGSFDDSKTVGELAAQFGGGGSAGGASSATAYASPDKPSIPPVSAAAGGSIPRANAPDAVGAVGGAPVPGAPAANPGAPAPNNPAWAGLNAALPVGPAGGPTPPGAAPTPSAPAAPPTQGSVASLASQAGIPAPVAANIAKAIGAAPDAPLDPQQALRAKSIMQSYAQRAQQQTGQQQQGAPGQPQPQQGGGPITPQFPLPPGIKDPQQAILAIDQDIARLGRFGPAAGARIKALEDMRERIAQSSAPIDVKPNTTLVDPRTRQVLYQGQQTNPGNIALQRFLSENPDATGEQIQQFVASGRTARSGVGMYMQRYLQENPNASAEEVAKAAQDFQSQGSSVTKFDTGKQGDSVRSFNVLVDHLGTLNSAADALKNGNIPLFNKAAQAIAQATGQAAPVDFDAVKNIVGDELVKAILGGGAALGDREEMKATINKANSPEQLAGVIDKYKNLALGQLKGLRKQYESSTGRDDFDSKLAPGTKAFFEGESKGGGDKGSSEGLPAGWTVTVH